MTWNTPGRPMQANPFSHYALDHGSSHRRLNECEEEGCQPERRMMRANATVPADVEHARSHIEDEYCAGLGCAPDVLAMCLVDSDDDGEDDGVWVAWTRADQCGPAVLSVYPDELDARRAAMDSDQASYQRVNATFVPFGADMQAALKEQT